MRRLVILAGCISFQASAFPVDRSPELLGNLSSLSSFGNQFSSFLDPSYDRFSGLLADFEPVEMRVEMFHDHVVDRPARAPRRRQRTEPLGQPQDGPTSLGVLTYLQNVVDSISTANVFQTLSKYIRFPWEENRSHQMEFRYRTSRRMTVRRLRHRAEHQTNSSLTEPITASGLKTHEDSASEAVENGTTTTTAALEVPGHGSTEQNPAAIIFSDFSNHTGEETLALASRVDGGDADPEVDIVEIRFIESPASVSNGTAQDDTIASNTPRGSNSSSTPQPAVLSLVLDPNRGAIPEEAADEAHDRDTSEAPVEPEGPFFEEFSLPEHIGAESITGTAPDKSGDSAGSTSRVDELNEVASSSALATLKENLQQKQANGDVPVRVVIKNGKPVEIDFLESEGYSDFSNNELRKKKK